jgi:GntR family transcriptional regulator / MocR family aminotransferase
MKRAPNVDLAGIAIDRGSPQPLAAQLYANLRSAILSGQLRPGARLPATRVLAQEIGVSRNTVVSAFEQLEIEGYLDARIGSGTRIASSLPDDLLNVRCGAKHTPQGRFTYSTLRTRARIGKLSSACLERAGSPPAFRIRASGCY